jgi:hypothetical protein
VWYTAVGTLDVPPRIAARQEPALRRLRTRQSGDVPFRLHVVVKNSSKSLMPKKSRLNTKKVKKAQNIPKSFPPKGY